MLYLHPISLSPDPTYARHDVRTLPGYFCGMDIWPHELMRAQPLTQALSAWGNMFDLFTPPPPVCIEPDAQGRAEWVVDFGTEVDAELEIDLESPCAMNVATWSGESLAEAEGRVFGEVPNPMRSRHLPTQGRHRLVFERRGLRFVRVLLQDMAGPVTLHHLVARSVFAFDRRDGDFACSDAGFQRVWQTSAYTARLCTRPDTLWDGIKRDRIGWFGDGRIIKLATDNVFFQPEPAEKMLLSLPTSSWANAVPNYSFDAVSMLKQHILTYGLERPCVRPAYEKIVAMLDWAADTQTDGEGFIVRRDDQKYFFGIGFVDWSRMPVGGRFEELSWLQCKYVEALRDAADLARWLDRSEDAARWSTAADQTARRVSRTFWRDGVCLIHTLNHVGEVANPHLPGYDGHYQKTYIDKLRLGPSGASRQSTALAILAGVLDERQRDQSLANVFNQPKVDPIITAYFLYYEQTARAMCGDVAGAIYAFGDYVGAMLEREDAACVWELWSPEVNDARKYASHFDQTWRYPLSLCHGWGAGAVPITTRWLLGIHPTKPGFGAISLSPCMNVPWSYQATVPTPHGPIKVERDNHDARIRFIVPRAIGVEPVTTENVLVEQR